MNSLVAAYGYKPSLIVFGADNSPDALLPVMEVKSLLGRTRAISLPFTDACGLLLTKSKLDVTEVCGINDLD